MPTTTDGDHLGSFMSDGRRMINGEASFETWSQAQKDLRSGLIDVSRSVVTSRADVEIEALGLTRRSVQNVE